MCLLCGCRAERHHIFGSRVWVAKTSDMDWFRDLFGFSEQGWKVTRSKLQDVGQPPVLLPEDFGSDKDVPFIQKSDTESTIRGVNGKTYVIGKFETPSVGELRQRMSGNWMESIFYPHDIRNTRLGGTAVCQCGAIAWNHSYEPLT